MVGHWQGRDEAARAPRFEGHHDRTLRRFAPTSEGPQVTALADERNFAEPNRTIEWAFLEGREVVGNIIAIGHEVNDLAKAIPLLWRIDKRDFEQEEFRFSQ